METMLSTNLRLIEVYFPAARTNDFLSINMVILLFIKQKKKKKNMVILFQEQRCTILMVFSDSLCRAFFQELKNLRPQLYSAAEYCEKSYLHSEQKQM